MTTLLGPLEKGRHPFAGQIVVPRDCSISIRPIRELMPEVD